MATAYLRAESAPVILPKHFSQAAAVMAQFDRDKIASAIDVLIELLDVIDGDPEAEDDDPAGGAIEDEPHDPEGDYDSADLIRGGGSAEGEAA